jgi:aminoglycoside phosphotransferase family enzyme
MDPDLPAKRAFLAQPEVWPDATSSVRVIDTHLAVVFLTDRHAYKLKRPIRRASIDFTTLQARLVDCEAEIELNRRLAPQVYLGMSALLMTSQGMQVWDAATTGAVLREGRVIDWLVKMVRLPADSMLDELIRSRRLTRAQLNQVGQTLARFYKEARPIPFASSDYVQRLRLSVEDTCSALSRPLYGQPMATVTELLTRQRRSLHRHGVRLAARAETGRIVEGHGDLRPEHVCLSTPPVFIDCLEFDEPLRAVDPADELAGLAVECEFLGSHEAGGWLFDAYDAVCHDPVDTSVIRFHTVQRALIRARLAAWHLDEPLDEALQRHWRERASAFLSLALTHARAKTDDDTTPGHMDW